MRIRGKTEGMNGFGIWGRKESAVWSDCHRWREVSNFIDTADMVPLWDWDEKDKLEAGAERRE